VGGCIEASRIPLSDAARAILDAGGAALADLMTGGEDYEVLATVPPARADDFERLAAAAGTRVTCIGTIVPPADGIIAVDAAGSPLSFTKMGWDHFSGR
jgi:thiamine-monophosphate kinase